MKPPVQDAHFDCCLCHARIQSSNRKYTLSNPSLRGMVREYHVKNELNYNINATDWLCVQCQSKFRSNKPLPTKIACRKTKNVCLRCTASSAVTRNYSQQQSSMSNEHYEFESISDLSESNNNDFHIGDTEPELVLTQSNNDDTHSVPAQSTFGQSVPNGNSMTEADIQSNSYCERSIPNIELKMQAVIATENCCFICREKTKGTRSVIPPSAILDLWINLQIYIPPKNRCCKSHIEKGKFKDDDIISIQRQVSEIQMNTAHVKYIIESLTTFAKNKSAAIIDFSDSSLFEDKDYELLLGLSKENFLAVFETIKNRLRSSCNRSAINALAMFLMKLRLDVSQDVLALLFNIRNKRAQATVSETLDAVAAALTENFVPKHLGYHRLNDPVFRQSNLSPYATKLLKPDHSATDSNNLIIILDGTYLYLQKPSDFELQKLLYSVHKYRNLAKPMMVIFPNGHILHVEGLFGADGQNSDAQIMNAMLKDLSELGITSVLNENDSFILDRGFRDSVVNLESRGYCVFMPSLLQKKNCVSLLNENETDENTNQQQSKANERESGTNKRNSKTTKMKAKASARKTTNTVHMKYKSPKKNAKKNPIKTPHSDKPPNQRAKDKKSNNSAKQFTTSEANQSRIVTMLRWVVEAVNGRVKNMFKFFSGTIPITYLPKLGDWFKIACALCNAFCPNIFNEKDDHMILADRALERAKQSNELQLKVITEKLDTKTACWLPASMETFPNFPALSLADLKNITLGVYQVNLAEYYAAQQVKAKGFEMQIHKDVGSLIRGQIKSRFSKKIHKLWIEFDNEKEGAAAITGYYCKCQVGARVVGCCAHVASLLWFLGYARHHKDQLPKRTSLADKIINAGVLLGNSTAEDDEAPIDE